jgi:hypothetical protein
MTRLADAAVSAAVTGTVAAIFTTVALGLLARAEGRPPLAPVNASGHWLHGEGAGKGGRADIAHTGTGLATNHLASIFWALPFEWRLAGKEAQTPGAILREAASMAAIAAAVDYGLMPKRLTPGWENEVGPRSVIAAFGAMALGLAAGAFLTQPWRERPGETRPVDV